ncbi:hypothetical protein, variant [Aphanomyces astaci]|uniref:Peptidase A1 domain-containing protein n=1 Tax=Aphanomyces astaci TaxID=112090 RepID=W4HCZ4_APHAT|nr:hypothetical protein, variant [Aphanomyces astaci]ETV89003.1 hypothetical protein, variant [Aphanomyces astaci]|eukprot:XP_009821403.1 hypothetical protein, variant [Aphanomyces astaci]
MPWVFFVAATAAAALAHATIIPKTYSNPWISIIIDGEQKRVLLSPMTQGIVLFQDIAAAEQKHRSSQVSVAFNGHSVQTMIKIVRRPPHLHVPWTVDGVIGVGIKSTRTELLWPYVNGSDPNSMQYTYSGMDYATGAASLQFGPSSDTILWSEPMNTVDDFYYQRFTSFPMYQVSVCGKSVTEATSSYWDAVVDFRSPCLTLPKEFYATLLAWAPLSYNATVNLTVVRPGVAAADLPTLRFQLSHFSPLLSLPLASFVLPGNATLLPTYLCIQPGHSVKHVVGNHWAYPDIDDQGDVFTNPLDDNMRVPNMYRSPIVLGTMALQSLGLVVHAKHTRVGFHRPSPPPSNVSGDFSVITTPYLKDIDFSHKCKS